MIPFLDIAGLHSPLNDEFARITSRVVKNNMLILGPEVEAFEEDFAAYCGARYAVGVSDGLEALQILLEAYGIGAGDEVIVPSNTFIATWLAVSACGARPVPVEPNPGTFNIDCKKVEEAISPYTKAILAVHLYGRPVEMAELTKVASKHSILLLEDAAQAHGAQLPDGRRVGSASDGAAFSFYPGKNLGALGDGGAIVTDNSVIAAFARRRRNYGSVEKYVHTEIGRNSRLDELQAAFLRFKLTRLDDWNARRIEIARRYNNEIENALIRLPTPGEGRHVWHLFVVETMHRAELQKYLAGRNIGTGVHYPIPPHKQACYPEYNDLELPIAESMARNVLSLPISPTMDESQVSVVISAVNEFAV